MRKAIPFRRRQKRPPPLSGPWGPRRNAPWLLAFAVLFGGAGGYLAFDLVSPASVSGGSVQSAAAASERIMGQASVIDGDTLEIHGTRIRLHGIDAPESDQLCLFNGGPSQCGQEAAHILFNKIGDSVVSCDPRDIDRYGRVVAVCFANGEDLNAWMVTNGWALAFREYSLDYVQQEQAASAAKAGMWQGEFVAPWEWRRHEDVVIELTPSAPADECAIKGNISSSGERIYHVPDGQYYSRTKISPSKGERWFCSEAEAKAAGWRRSKR